MASQTSLVAVQVRLQQWARQIHECQNRPVGVTVEDWCDQHDITKANYYYRLKRVRQACLEATGTKPASFVEVPVHALRQKEQDHSMTHHSETVAVLHAPNGLSLEILPVASVEMLEKLIRIISHAE